MEGPELGRVVSKKPAFTGLRAGDRVLVTGGTGWMGRELVSRLRRGRPEIPVLLVSSLPRTITFGRDSIETIGWNQDAIERWSPTVAVHLAYLTREKIHAMGRERYIYELQELRARASEVYSVGSVRAVTVASSGAAVALPQSPYGEQKIIDEDHFTRLGLQYNVPTVIARIWSVSGAYCQRPGDYAIYDLIRQSLHQAIVRVKADRLVWRRYVDAGEFLEICLSAAADSWSGTVDSGGALTELRALAIEIQRALGTNCTLDHNVASHTEDRYYSDSPVMDVLAARAGIVLSDLERQILRSRRAIT